MKRFGTSLLVAVAVTLAMAAPAQATFVFSDDVDFELLNDDLFGSLANLDFALAASGDGVDPGEGEIGGLMFEGEFIHVLDAQIQFSLFGGGEVVVAPGFRNTGFDTDASYRVSGLRVLPGFEIASVSLLFDPLRVTNLDNGDVSFTSDSITLRIGELGIAETSANVGLVTANVTFRATQDPPDPPTDVPEPGTFALLGSGVAAAWYRRRRAAGRIVSAS